MDPLTAAVLVLAVLVVLLFAAGAGLYRRVRELEPATYRGVLQKIDQANGAVIDWPWTDVAPTDFKGDANELLLDDTLTPAQVTALKIPGVQGGMLGLYLQKDGSLYSLALRPLLPDEST